MRLNSGLLDHDYIAPMTNPNREPASTKAGATPQSPPSWRRGYGMRGQLYFLVAATIAPVILLLGIWTLRERQAESAGLNAQVLAEAALLRRDLDRHYQHLEAVLGTLGVLAGSKAGGISADLLATIMGSQPDHVSNLAVFNAAGEVEIMHRDPEDRLWHRSIADQDFFKEALRQDGMVLSTPYASRIDGRLIMVAARRIAGPDGVPRGVAVTVTDMERFKSALVLGTRLKGADIMLLTDRSPSGQSGLGTKLPAGGMPGSVGTLSRARAGDWVNYDWSEGVDGKQTLRLALVATRAPWIMVLNAPHSADADPAVHDPEIVFLLAAMLALSSGFVAASWIARGYRKQVRVISDEAGRSVLDGSSWRMQPGLAGELGELEHACNRMADKIKFQRDQLAAESELNRHLWRGAADWVWEQDRDFRYTRFTHFAEGIVLLPTAHAIGKCRWDMPCENMTAAKWDEHKATLLAHKPFRDLTLQMRGQDGMLHILRVSGDPQFDERGEFIGYRGTGVDITQTLEVGAAVKLAERRWVAALEGAGHGVWDWDLRTNRIFRSRIWCRLLGLAADALSEDPELLNQMVHPDDIAPAMQAFTDHIEGRTPRYATQYRIRHADGGGRWMLDQGMAIEFNPDGSAARVVGTLTDITASKELEVALRQSESRLDTIFRRSALPMNIVDFHSDEIVDVNEAFCETFGWGRHECVGLAMHELGIRVDYARREELLRRIEVEGSIRGFENQYRNRAGEVFDFLLFIDKIELNGRVLLLTQGLNITNEKQSRLARERAEKWSRQLFEASPARLFVTRLDDGCVVDMNTRTLLDWGMTREEMLGKTTSDLGFWQDQADHATVTAMLLEKGRVSGFRFRQSDRSGRHREMLLHADIVTQDEESYVLSQAVDISELTDVQRALSASEERLKIIFHQAALPMMIIDLESLHLLQVNHAFAAMFGLSAEDIIGHPLGQLGIWNDPADQARVTAGLKADGRVRGMELQLKARSGRLFDFLIFVDTIMLSGRPAIVSQGIDITEQKQSRRKLEEATRWARALVDYSPTSMILSRLSDGIIVEVNDRASELLEYSREELIGTTTERLGNWPEAVQRESALSKLASTGSLRGFPALQRTRSGEIKDVLIYVEIITLDGQQFVLGQAVDVTEQTRIRRALAESEQQMKSLFTHGPVPMLIASVDSQCIIQINPALERVLGISNESVVGKNTIDLGIWEHIDSRDHLYSALKTHGRVEGLQTRFRTWAGEIVDYALSAEIIPYGGQRAMIVQAFDVTASRRALDEAEKSRRWFHMLFDLSPISMTILRPDGKVVMANRACAEMYGLPIDTIVGRTTGENNLWVDNKDRTMLWERLQRDGYIRDMILRRKRADGRSLDVLVYVDPFEIDGENYYITQGIDVSQTQEAERALRAMTAMNSAAFNAVGESLVVHNGAGRVILCNATAERILGASGHVPLGATLLEPAFNWCNLDGSTAMPERLPFRRVLETGVPIREQVMGLRNPELRWFSVSSEPIDQDEDGVLEGTVTSFFDITDRVRAEAELRVLLDRMQMQLERMPIACFLTDADFNVIYWNPASRRMFGYTAEEMLGYSADVLTPANMQSTVRELIKGTLASPTGVDFGNENLTRSGKRLTCEWRSNSLFGADGQFVATMHMAIDMTDVIESQRRLKRLNEDLEHRVAQRTRELSATIRELELFSYTVAHDLRAPLRALDGYSHLLAEGGPDAGAFLARIRSNVSHMTGLIDGLLNYGRIGRQAINQQSINMNRLVDVVIADLKYIYPQTRFEFAQMASVMGDETLLRQVWTNLIGNACKFSGKQAAPMVTVWCEQSAHNRLRYFVRDNGVGFEMQFADRLFGVFERLHRQDEYAGSGVGLSIVKRIVERHGGAVGADSEPGKGSTFWFELPLHQEDPDSASG